MITCTFEEGYIHPLRHVVVHALVVRNNSILLEKRAGGILETGKWALPGGFLSQNETIAQGALRELHEETGWVGKVKSLFRINSTPERPNDENRQNVIFEFLITPVKDSGKRDWETSEIAWVPFNKLLPYDEYAFDHGNSIKLVVEYFKKPFPLPIII